MLLLLAEFLQQYYSGFAVFQYLTLRGILGVLTALAMALFLGPWMIRTLQIRQIGQAGRNDGPQSHLSKKGKRGVDYSINAVRQHLTQMANSGKLKKGCAHCNSAQPHYVRYGLSIRKEFSEKDIEQFESEQEKEFALAPFTAEQAYSILHHIQYGHFHL